MRQASSLRPGLLVMPGWDDDGKRQYDDLKAELAQDAWLARRADLPDARWPAERRDSVTRGDNLQQVLADFDALSAVADPHAIAALGFSYGGYMAALLSAERPVHWLILRSPALYPDEHWTSPKAELDKHALDVYRRQLHGAQDNRALGSCARFRGHVLLIESEHDEVIPRQVIDSYAVALGQARSLTRHVLRGADHPLSAQSSRDAYHALVVDWLVERQAVDMAA